MNMIVLLHLRDDVRVRRDVPHPLPEGRIARHYLSSATCLMRPHLFYALCVVSWVTILRNMICHF